MHTAVITHVETPPPPASGKGKGLLPPTSPAPSLVAASMIEQKPDPEVIAAMNRVAAIEKIGKEIGKAESALARAETAVATVDAERKEAMGERNRKEKVLDELRTELVNLSKGGFSERLNFPDPAKVKIDMAAKSATPSITTGKPAPTDESWRTVRLDTLTPKISPTKLKLLAEHSTPIVTIGDLQDYTAKRGEWWAKDIKGFGESGQRQVDDALFAYWQANPQKVDTKPAMVQVDNEQFIRNADGKLELMIDGKQIDKLTHAHVSAALRVFAVSDVITPDLLGVTKDQLEAACHPHLLSKLQQDKTADVHHIIVLQSLRWLCVLPEAGVTGAAYRLLPLYALNTEPTVPRRDHEAGEYFAKHVKHEGTEYVIGARADGILAADKQPTVETSETATKPTAKGGKKKSKK